MLLRIGRGNRRRRKGTVLILVVLLVFCVMAIAALCIDLGMVHVTQRQMQTAVDAAALEGLRGRDLLAEQDRRQNASQMVAWTFAADLNPQTVDDQYGAGPIVQFDGGFGDPTLAASQTLSVPVEHVYKPQRSDGTPGLELNLPDQASGDMVAGQYNAGQPETESTDFSRADFAPFNQATQPNRDAFLVRMRRTRNASGLDQAAGISSSGPPLPYLFAKGSLLQMQTDLAQNPSGYSPRQQGVSVRATAIAQGEPALYVGPQYPSLYPASVSQPPQVAPFALPIAYWNGVAANSVVTLNLDAASGTTIDSVPQGFPIRSTTLRAPVGAGDTTIQVASVPFSIGDRVTIGSEVMQITAISTSGANPTLTVTRQIEGTLAGSYSTDQPLTAFAPVVVGQLSSPLQSSLPDGILFPAASQPVRLYVPLFDTISVGTSGTDSVQVIVGFGVANAWTPDQTQLRQFSLQKIADFHALLNASASPAAASQTWAALEQYVATTFPQTTAADRNTLVTDLLGRALAIDSPLLSPALVR